MSSTKFISICFSNFVNVFLVQLVPSFCFFGSLVLVFILVTKIS